MDNGTKKFEENKRKIKEPERNMKENQTKSKEVLRNMQGNQSKKKRTSCICYIDSKTLNLVLLLYCKSI